jgi:hypothetical protein
MASRKFSAERAGETKANVWSLETRKNNNPTISHIAKWSEHYPGLAAVLKADKTIRSLRDVALRYDAGKLAHLVDSHLISERHARAKNKPTHAVARSSAAKSGAAELHNKLFHTETSAVLQRMVQRGETGVSDPAIRSGVVNVLDRRPTFDIRKESIYKALSHPDALKGVSAVNRPAVVEHLKALQRVQALSPTAEAVPKLLKANLTSAFHISEMGESSFLKAHSKSLGQDVARGVYTNAVNARVKNEHTLMHVRDAVNGTGIGLLDKNSTAEERVASARDVLKKYGGGPIDFSQLFGGTDLCECKECNSVYSPAAYFVELLNYLRNNNLKPTSGQPAATNGYAGTVLEQLFRRRPDLGCLELTCENTYTALPYIDLANEVMESLVQHLPDYIADTHTPKQATIDAFNVTDEPSAELVAQPLNINYTAYCKLKSAPYPFSLPYHQPIDATRILLDYIGTSRRDLLKRYGTALEDTSALGLSPADDASVQQLHLTAQKRAVKAETLGLTQEDYIILTREAFWKKEYFELTQKTTFTVAQYQQSIGVLPVYKYYGYSSNAQMLSTNTTTASGATFVPQFLTRTGIEYKDLVALLQTFSINPGYPQGRALVIMQSLLLSYRYMQGFVVQSSHDPAIRFGQLITFLQTAQGLLLKFEALLNPDPCHQHLAARNGKVTKQELKQWVECWFDRVGKLIVIESGDGPQGSVSGSLSGSNGGGHTDNESKTLKDVGSLAKDGTILNTKGRPIGRIDANGKAVTASGTSLLSSLKMTDMAITHPTTGAVIGVINQNGVTGVGTPVNYAIEDSCDLAKARLIHLDGTPVTIDEYDRMQRFIRLWRRTEWTIDELDKALLGYQTPAANGVLDPSAPPAAGAVIAPATANVLTPVTGFSSFVDNCNVAPASSSAGSVTIAKQAVCPAPKLVKFSITPDFLAELVAIQELKKVTGKPLVSILSFWSPISTAGNASLYATLFLQFNVTALDPVFKSDINGNFLAAPAKISEHVPGLMAALQVKSDDIATIVALRHMADVLDLDSLSILYRHVLLARVLGIPVSSLPRALAVFGEPFVDAKTTRKLLKVWNTMTVAGFSYRQLDLVINDYDDPRRPLAFSFIKGLQLCKTLHDGLGAIDTDQADPDATHPELITDDLIRAKAGLLYDSATVERIVAFLNGTTLYITNAPLLVAPFLPVIPATLAPRFKYLQSPAPPSASIQATGILPAAAEIDAVNADNTNANWVNAVGRIWTQFAAGAIFDDVIGPVFNNLAAAKTVLLSPDDDDTPAQKRLYFLQSFMPFLRRSLARQFVIDTMSSAVDLDDDTTEALLANLLQAGAPLQPALEVLLALDTGAALAPATLWKGYLIGPANDSFTFSVQSDTAPLLPPNPLACTLDGIPLNFNLQQADPNNIWWSAPVALKSGQVYTLQIDTDLLPSLSWKRATTAAARVPSSFLIPDDSTQAALAVFRSLTKAAIVANGFNLDGDELSFFQTNAANFSAFDLNAFTLEHWKQLRRYASIRDALPASSFRLIDLFGWCSPLSIASLPIGQNGTTLLPGQIAKATQWDVERVTRFVATESFNIAAPANFVNEINLSKLQKAIALADKTGMDVNRLFDWAHPTSKFWDCHATAESIRNTLQARFIPTEWEQVVKPLNDTLRTNQQHALVNFLLAQQPVVEWGVTDANSLFEFLLIDVKMCTCMQTSRIKQGIASVQQYVERCMLGWEAPYVEASVLDRARWTWMQKDTLWEANRKVFLYPENWLVPSLRDDKSSFYEDLESELQQKDVSPDLIESALQRYLYAVDEVANMQVIGLHVSGLSTSSPVLHVFARTRATPNRFYYRYFNYPTLNWTPWQQVPIDFPVCEVADPTTGATQLTGVYVTPVVWNNRLLVFFPEFLKKSAPQKQSDTTSFKDAGGSPLNQQGQNEYWEIKLSWVELRKGTWTQKRTSRDTAFHYIQDGYLRPGPPFFGTSALPKATSLTDISRYIFVPRLPLFINTTFADLFIDIYYGEAQPSPKDTFMSSVARFTFGGNELNIDPGGPPSMTPVPNLVAMSFQLVPDGGALDAFPLEADLKGNPVYLPASLPPDAPPQPYPVPYAQSGATNSTIFLVIPPQQPFNYNANVADGLLQAVNTEDLNGLYEAFQKITATSTAMLGESFGATYTTPVSYNELNEAYAIYNWEFGLYSVIEMVDKMVSAQQFDASLNMLSKVFDPASADTDPQRFWKFPPFKQITPEASLEAYFESLLPGVADPNITAWRDAPFEPFVVARGRPVTFMKWAAMKYVQVMLAYGDFYFRQNTLETVPLAIQCYVLASNILGPKPQVIPKRGTIQPETYQSLLNRWDAFGNAVVELELLFPFSNQINAIAGFTSNGSIGLPNVFGFASSLYFGIPPNAQLLALRSLIDDRLYKIRHCEDINGVFRNLPLFEASVDPGLLVEAEALGLSLQSVLSNLTTPTPNYRFNYLLQKAYGYCNQVKSLGAAFLAAKEKGDAEGLARLKAAQESTLSNAILELRNQQLAEANAAFSALQQSRNGPVNRLQHYLQLIGASLSAVPDADTDYAVIADPIETPVTNSGLVLNQYENEEMTQGAAAAIAHEAVGHIEAAAGILALIPQFRAHVQVFGIGPSVDFGGQQLSQFVQATARIAQVVADELSYESSNAAKKAGYLRQLQDRVLQANAAGLEIKTIDQQIVTQKIRIDIATKEIANQQLQVDNAKAVEDFLKNKYTNQELYTWMQGAVSTLYYQSYGLADDMASRAEAVYRFERPTSATFLAPGYWDGSHDGLLAGEQLEIALNKMEAQYVHDRAYDNEIPRPQFSLREINPLALIELRASGSCQFSLPEVLHDKDFPGDYMRRIKFIVLDVAAVVGPGVSLSGRLQLLAHRFRTTTEVSGGYIEIQDTPDGRFSTVNVPISAIAVATGQSEHGVFELAFNGERYLPFEGAGAISTWQLQLPPDIRPFDYNTIADVGIQLHYTSCDGDAHFQSAASAHLKDYFKAAAETLGPRDGLFAAFELSRDFPDLWYRTVQAGAAGTTTFALDEIVSRLPYYAQFASGAPRAAKNIRATDIYFVTEAALAAAYNNVTFAGSVINSPDEVLSDCPALSVVSLLSTSVPADQWEFSFDYTAPAPPQSAKLAWLVIRFTLQ